MAHASLSRREQASACAHERVHRWVRGLLGVGVAAAALSSRVCMVTGEVDDVSGGSVIGTTDGGGTWQQLATPPGAGALAAVACATAVICEVVGSGNGDAGAVYGTSNGGQSWTTQPAVIGGGFFLGVACPSIEVCEAAGNEGMIFGTVNGGASWTQQDVRREVGVLVSTNNGGVTWIHRHIPTGTDDLTSVACTPSGLCEAVGLGSTAIIGSTDGGRTWTAQVVPGSPYLLGVACPGRRTCEAVGQDADDGVAVYRTTDGGAKWYRQRVP